jgi:hypothetical protein
MKSKIMQRLKNITYLLSVDMQLSLIHLYPLTLSLLQLLQNISRTIISLILFNIAEHSTWLMRGSYSK